jgi:predicted secreted hydrolase
VPLKLPVRHGEGGIVNSQDGANMFYYFMPMCKVTGTVTLDGQVLQVDSSKSSGWYDHEFGGKPLMQKKEEVNDEAVEKPSDRGWNWFGLQLDDVDVQITAALLCDTSGKQPRTIDKAAIVVDADGNSERFSEDKHGGFGTQFGSRGGGGGWAAEGRRRE